MYNLKRFYNQNRKTIWWVIGIVAFLLIVLRVINYFAAKNNEKMLSSGNTNIVNISNVSDQVQVTSEQSAVTGDKISNETLTSVNDLITTFLENCNNDRIEEAYNMLTEECKEEVYSSIEDFKTYYCGNFFKNYRASFEIANWFGSTYKVDIIPDMLSTGKTNEGYVNQDYITIKRVDGEYKLNVNSYIGRTNTNITKEQDGVIINVNYKDVYMDYEKYNITVKNETENRVCLDTKENVKTMYLEDENKVQYSAITNEIIDDTLIIENQSEKTLDIKYYSKYSSTKNILKLVFSNIILDYDRYESNGENGEIEISVNI